MEVILVWLAVELRENRFKNTLSVGLYVRLALPTHLFCFCAAAAARVLSTHSQCDRRKFLITLNIGLRLQHLTITVAHRNDMCFTTCHLAASLWSPYVIGRPYIFSCCGLFFLLSFFSSPNLSRRRLDVCHTSTHGVALVRI